VLKRETVALVTKRTPSTQPPSSSITGPPVGLIATSGLSSSIGSTHSRSQSGSGPGYDDDADLYASSSSSSVPVGAPLSSSNYSASTSYTRNSGNAISRDANANNDFTDRPSSANGGGTARGRAKRSS
jgi:hypothetical protein